MKGRSSPVCGFAFQDIEDEARELWPGGKTEPEKGVNRDSKKKSDRETEETRLNDRTESESPMV